MVEFIDIKTLLSLRTMFDLVNYAADFRSEIIAGVSVLGIPPEGGVVWLQHDTNQDFGLIHYGSDAPFNRRETLFSYEGWYKTLESVYTPVNCNSQPDFQERDRSDWQKPLFLG